MTNVIRKKKEIKAVINNITRKQNLMHASKSDHSLRINQFVNWSSTTKATVVMQIIIQIKMLPLIITVQQKLTNTSLILLLMINVQLQMLITLHSKHLPLQKYLINSTFHYFSFCKVVVYYVSLIRENLTVKLQISSFLCLSYTSFSLCQVSP